MRIASVVLVVDPVWRRYLMQRKDIGHPRPEFRNKLSFFGGLVETGEDSLMALQRELSEELPGWGEQARLKSLPEHVQDSSPKDWTLLETLSVDPTFSWELRILRGDLGPISLSALRRACTEGTPEIWSFGQLPAESDCLPGVRVLLGNARARGDF